MPSEKHVLGEHARDRRRGAASARVREHEVADLDDLPLGIEVVERAAADDFAGLGVDGGERQQPSPFGERRQLLQRGHERFAIERGKVPGFAELRVDEGGQDRVHVFERGEAENDVASTNPVRRH